jgi:hypothetical protein
MTSSFSNSPQRGAKPVLTCESMAQAAAILDVDKSVLAALKAAGADGFRHGRIHLVDLAAWWLAAGDEHPSLTEAVAWDFTAALYLWKRRNGLIR